MNYKPYIDPEPLRKHYSKSLNENKILLTAHSHQCWPDIVEEGQLEYVRMAFKHADLKWDYLFGELIPRFQRLVSERTGNPNPALLANGENTHELVTRVMSCFKWDSSVKFVTTDSEFHSLKRQLYRLKEEGVNITFVPAKDKTNLTERIINAIDEDTDLVLLSTVFFNDGYMLQDIKSVISKAREAGAVLLFDSYHHFNIRQLDIKDLGDDIFFTAGGYKYANSGEGAAWLKIPADCELRPRITGWFADFESLGEKEYPYPVKYGSEGSRFLGATRDLSGISRQTAVLDFMNSNGLTVELLEKNNLYQLSYLIHLYDTSGLQNYGLKLISSRNDNERGPFLSLDTGSAESAYFIYKELWEKYQVLTDTRGSVLRIGPAPYTTSNELEIGIEGIKKIISK